MWIIIVSQIHYRKNHKYVSYLGIKLRFDYIDIIL